MYINRRSRIFGMPQLLHDAPGDGGGSGGAGGGNANNGQSQGGTSGQKGAEFTPEQQAKVQELIDQAFGRGASKVEKEYKSRIEQLEAELSKIKGGSDKDQQHDPQGSQGQQQGKPEGKYYTQEDLQKILSQKDDEYGKKLKDAEERVAKLLDKERTAAIISAASKANAIDPDDVAVLVSRYITHDEDGKLIVLSDNGQTARLNSKGEPMSVEEFVKSYVDGKPHLKRGSNTPGVGSTTDNTRDPKIPMSAAEKIAAGLAKM